MDTPDVIDRMLAAWRAARPDLDPSPMGLVGRVIVLAQHLERSVEGALEKHRLSLGQFDILATLIARPRSAFTRRELLEAVWGPGWYGDEHVVDVHVAHLRRKLSDDAATPRYIRTVRGIGYGMAKG